MQLAMLYTEEVQCKSIAKSRTIYSVMSIAVVYIQLLMYCIYNHLHM